MATSTEKCDTCQKSSLSILLLRPSPIAKGGSLATPGADSVKSDDGLLNGLVPARTPGESRYVLRLLRAGYVHVYIKSPPDGKHWLVYRVTQQADLIPQSHPLFNNPDADLDCKKPTHNVSDMKILTIPQAHKIDEIWAAYSANLWNETLKKQNQANPKVMQSLTLQGACTSNVFEPTLANLQSKVLECALTKFTIDKDNKHDFPFTSLVTEAKKLAETLKNAAACHTKTKGKEVAMVLADPVGLAAEFNALRVRRNNLAEKYTENPEVRQPLEVNKFIEGLKENMIVDLADDALDEVSPLMNYDEYTSKTFPPGATWPPLTPEERARLITPISQNAIRNTPDPFSENIRGKLGRVTYPDTEVKAAAWARKEAESSWKKMEKHYDEGKRTAWIKTFSDTMKLRHFDPLQRFEEDWDAALNDPALAQYFELHFDKNAPNNVIEDARRGCSSGSKYCHEASLAYVPGPLTETAIKTFEAQLEADITKPNAILMRAMVGNQQSLFDIITNDKRDKTYDFIKGVIGEFEKQKPAIKLSWLSSATMGFTTGILGVFGGVVAHGIAKRLELNLLNKIDPAQLAKLQHAQSMGLIHRTCEEALAAAISGKAPKVPVLLMATIDADTLGQIMRGRGAMMNAKNRRKLGSRNVQIGILTDSEALAKFKDNAAKSTGNGVHDLAVNADSIVLNEQAIALKAEAVKKSPLAQPLALALP